MNLELIKKILEEEKETTGIFKRNLVKEYLQVLALSFTYSHKDYQNLVFYGGSCLKHCHDLPRLSEDLDFVDLKKKIDLKNLADDLKKFYKKELGIEIVTKIQKFRIYLKFPLLYELNLSKQPESNFLFIKIEIFSKFDFCKDYKIEIKPLFKFGKSLLVKTFDLPTLMATKLRAVLYRKWEKTTKTGKTLARVKGRDYFDLMWYLQKEIKPNLDCLEEKPSPEELKDKLLQTIEKVDPRSISLDLEGLIEDQTFVKGLSKSLKEILIREIENLT